MAWRVHMQSAFSWLTIPASVSPGCAGPQSPPGRFRLSPPAMTGGDIVCAARSATALALLIGDVMGHGPRAARTSGEVTRAFRTLARRPGPVEDAARGLHEFLTGRLSRDGGAAGSGGGDSGGAGSGGADWDGAEADLAAWDAKDPDCAARDDGAAWDDGARALGEEYVTALIISVPLDAGGEAMILNCGHPAPLLLERERGHVSLLDAIPSAPPLGLLDLGDGSLCPVPLPLAAGDSLLLYTDGVTEARDRQGRQYPLAERVAALIEAQWPRQRSRRHHLAGAALLREIQADLLRHAGGSLADDATLLLIGIDREPSRPLSPPAPAAALPVLLSEAADCQGSFLS
jgi:hypothetical protein